MIKRSLARSGFRSTLLHRCFMIPGSSPLSAHSLKMIRDSLTSRYTERGLPVTTQRFRILVGDVFLSIDASCSTAAWRIGAGSLVLYTIDFSTRRGTSASAARRRRAISIATFPILGLAEQTDQRTFPGQICVSRNLVQSMRTLDNLVYSKPCCPSTCTL